MMSEPQPYLNAIGVHNINHTSTIIKRKGNKDTLLNDLLIDNDLEFSFILHVLTCIENGKT